MLYLQELSKQGLQKQTITLSERLPKFLMGPCQLETGYEVKALEDFYLIHLHVKGLLSLQCQRCLDEFDFPYDNQTVIAVCHNDERAEQILDRYESVVSSNYQLSLEEVLIDELHLYLPQFHLKTSDCSSEINQILAGKNEFY